MHTELNPTYIFVFHDVCKSTGMCNKDETLVFTRNDILMAVRAVQNTRKSNNSLDY